MWLFILIHFTCKVPTAGEGGAFYAFFGAHVSGGLVVLPGAGSGESGADAGIGGIVPVFTEGAFFPHRAVHLDVYEGPHKVLLSGKSFSCNFPLKRNKQSGKNPRFRPVLNCYILKEIFIPCRNYRFFSSSAAALCPLSTAFRKSSLALSRSFGTPRPSL